MNLVPAANLVNLGTVLRPFRPAEYSNTLGMWSVGVRPLFRRQDRL